MKHYLTSDTYQGWPEFGNKQEQSSMIGHSGEVVLDIVFVIYFSNIIIVILVATILAWKVAYVLVLAIITVS